MGGDSSDSHDISDGTGKCDDETGMATFMGSLVGPPFPQAPWSMPFVIVPCHAWQIWRP